MNDLDKASMRRLVQGVSRRGDPDGLAFLGSTMSAPIALLVLGAKMPMEQVSAFYATAIKLGVAAVDAENVDLTAMEDAWLGVHAPHLVPGPDGNVEIHSEDDDRRMRFAKLIPYLVYMYANRVLDEFPEQTGADIAEELTGFVKHVVDRYAEIA